ncbi:MAG: aminotransferase class I/II-fold pyridoxal phosphate-dependent enzyme [bacterium]
MKKDQNRTPLFDAVLGHAKRKMASFHTPGHKNGRSIDTRLKRFSGSNIFFMDVTVFPDVDSLHHPKGPLKEAQELSAEAFGVKHSFFLVNGSTSGVQAMILIACNPGDEIIVSRNTHKSVIGGIILSGASPIYVTPHMHEKLNLFYDLAPEQIEKALRRHPKAKAVLISSPTYHGICTDIGKIARIVHKRKKILLVDEAWGPHLKFHKSLPPSAVDCGADLVVQSAHKVGSAMSQGSLLQVNSNAVDMERAKRIVSMLQSTSPSYIILCSLDLARRQFAKEGKAILGKLLKLLHKAARDINRIKGVSCLVKQDLDKGYLLDRTKLSISVRELGISGHDISRFLNKKYNIQVDCSNVYNIIAIAGLGTDKADLDKLVYALKDIADKYRKAKPLRELPFLPLETEMVMTPADALARKSEKVSLKKAVGKVSAEIFSMYPPGIPILIPGELIKKEVCDYLDELKDVDPDVKGKKVKVVCE